MLFAFVCARSRLLSCVFCSPFCKDIILAGGSEGYPVHPTHADLRDTELATSMEAKLDGFHRTSMLVDLSRSVW